MKKLLILSLLFWSSFTLADARIMITLPNDSDKVFINTLCIKGLVVIVATSGALSKRHVEIMQLYRANGKPMNCG